MFRKASRSVCTSTIVLSADPDPYTTLLDITTTENTKEEPDDPELADEGDI